MKLPDTLDVTVSQDHIDNGERDDSSDCPVANGTNDALRLLGLVGVLATAENTYVTFRSVEDDRCVALADYPPGERQRIKEFDDEGDMEPHTFTLTLRPPASEVGLAIV